MGTNEVLERADERAAWRSAEPTDRSVGERRDTHSVPQRSRAAGISRGPMPPLLAPYREGGTVLRMTSRRAPRAAKWRFGAALAAGVLLAALAALAPVAGAAGDDAPPPAPPRWETVLDWIREERDRFAADLEHVHSALLERARVEQPDLVASLSPEPPRPRPRGYGILPPLLEDAETCTVLPTASVYSLETLSTTFASEVRDAALLARRCEAEPDAPLAERVERFLALRARLHNFEEHISYHAFWQRAVADAPDAFAHRNETLALVREWDRLRRAAGSVARIEDLYREIRERVAPFRATPGLRLETSADGARVLRVPIVTDIDDDAFLARFVEGVDEAWNQSEAARALELRLELELERVDAAALYPDGVPALGTPIDEREHLARFPEQALVLTSGGDSTHAFVGRAIFLGPDPVAPRTLAHELGHLLGFSDAYLRAHDQGPGAPFGSVLVEWTGLLDDLMGSPGKGVVTRRLVEQLLEAYGA